MAKYITDVVCNNCGFLGPHEIEKGVSVKDAGCPRCETDNLSKTYKTEVSKPRVDDFR